MFLATKGTSILELLFKNIALATVTISLFFLEMMALLIFFKILPSPKGERNEKMQQYFHEVLEKLCSKVIFYVMANKNSMNKINMSMNKINISSKKPCVKKGGER